MLFSIIRGTPTQTCETFVRTTSTDISCSDLISNSSSGTFSHTLVKVSITQVYKLYARTASTARHYVPALNTFLASWQGLANPCGLRRWPRLSPMLLSFSRFETQHQKFKVFLKGEFEGESFLSTKSFPLKVVIFEKLNSIATFPPHYYGNHR